VRPKSAIPHPTAVGLLGTVWIRVWEVEKVASRQQKKQETKKRGQGALRAWAWAGSWELGAGRKTNESDVLLAESRQKRYARTSIFLINLTIFYNRVFERFLARGVRNHQNCFFVRKKSMSKTFYKKIGKNSKVVPPPPQFFSIAFLSVSLHGNASSKTSHFVFFLSSARAAFGAPDSKKGTYIGLHTSLFFFFFSSAPLAKKNTRKNTKNKTKNENEQHQLYISLDNCVRAVISLLTWVNYCTY
jgi:hypothetical protein